MSTPTNTVKTFLAMWETPGGFEKSIHAYFTPETVYENVGMTLTTGLDEAVAVFTGFDSGFGIKTMWVENLAIAENGGKVLTERVDHARDAEGKTVLSLRVMGIFDVADGKITAWRDYFDTAGLGAGG